MVMDIKEAIKHLEELNTLYANGRLGYYKDFVNKTKEVIELMINKIVPPIAWSAVELKISGYFGLNESLN